MVNSIVHSARVEKEVGSEFVAAGKLQPCADQMEKCASTVDQLASFKGVIP